MFTNRRALSAVSISVASLVWASFPSGAAVAAPTAASATANAVGPATVLTDKDNGSTVTANIGDTIVVKLSGNATTGSTWKLASLSTQDAKLVGDITYDDTPASGTSAAAGRPGIFTATFAAVAAGTSVVTLNDVGPSSVDAAPIGTFSFTLTIAAPASGMHGTTPPTATKFVKNSFVTPDTTIKYVDGSSYTGGIKQGMPAGPGTYTWTTGNTKYATGTWSGRALSDGHIQMADGSQYTGDLNADGKAQGPARFDYPNGTIFTTTFADGDYTGPSTLTTPVAGSQGGTADVVTVDVVPAAATLTGPASETFANGSTVTGTMSGGKFDGPATYTPAVGPGEGKPKFQAAFVDGIWQGPYTWTDPDGSRLSGTIRNGSLQGRAVTTSSNGKACSGQLTGSGDFVPFSGPVDESGRPNGRGKLGCAGDEIFTGFYAHGKMVGTIYDHQTDGTLYIVDVGSKPTSILSGAARVKLPNGNVATGHLTPDGKLVGAGSYQFGPGGDVRYGRWEHGILVDTD